MYAFLALTSIPMTHLFVVHIPTAFVDLSEAVKLKNVFFTCYLDPWWIYKALRTITHSHKDIQRISVDTRWSLHHRNIVLAKVASLEPAIGEAIFLRWLELDLLLVQLWESHSVRPSVLYKVPSSRGRRWARSCIETLLPEITARGIVDFPEHSEIRGISG